MEFTRRRVKGSQKTNKLWVSDCGDYKITWSSEYGFERYYACVRTERFDGKTWWSFVGRRGSYKTRKKATEECLRNKKLWEAFIKLSHSDGRRDSRLMTLASRAPNVFRTLPVWVRPLAEPSLIKMLLPCELIQDPDEPSETLKTSESTSSPRDSEPSETSGPTSTVVESDGSSSETNGDSTSLQQPPRATNATELEKAPKPKSKQPTRKSCTSVAKASKPGKAAKRSDKPRSKSSPKTKGKR